MADIYLRNFNFIEPFRIMGRAAISRPYNAAFRITS